MTTEIKVGTWVLHKGKIKQVQEVWERFTAGVLTSTWYYLYDDNGNGDYRHPDDFEIPTREQIEAEILKTTEYLTQLNSAYTQTI
jgi:hypothetical protein